MDVLKKYRTHIILFIITIITTTLAGSEWMYGKFLFWGLTLEDFKGGFHFSIPFLLILTIHEFGHYLTARYYQIKVTLPYYIPLWIGFIGAPSIGTMGAFIKILGRPKTTRQFFDIGVAGPLAGFVIAIFVLLYGLYTLPPKDYIFEIHPEYKIFGENYEDIVYQLDTTIYTGNQPMLTEAEKEHLGDSVYFSPFGLKLGSNLLFDFMIEKVAPEPEKVPNMMELYHYPYLFAGYLALFFTALNLLPVGQLDGGHVLYGLLGYRKSNFAFKIIYVTFILFAGFGVITVHLTTNELFLYGIIYMLYLNIVFTSISKDIKIRLLISIWVFIAQYITSKFITPSINSYVYLVFGFVVGRFLGTSHPPSEIELPLDMKRKIIGWAAMLVFVVSFSPSPFNMDLPNTQQIESREKESPGQAAYNSNNKVKSHYMEDGIDLTDHP